MVHEFECRRLSKTAFRKSYQELVDEFDRRRVSAQQQHRDATMQVHEWYHEQKHAVTILKSREEEAKAVMESLRKEAVHQKWSLNTFTAAWGNFVHHFQAGSVQTRAPVCIQRRYKDLLNQCHLAADKEFIFRVQLDLLMRSARETNMSAARFTQEWDALKEDVKNGALRGTPAGVPLRVERVATNASAAVKASRQAEDRELQERAVQGARDASEQLGLPVECTFLGQWDPQLSAYRLESDSWVVLEGPWRS